MAASFRGLPLAAALSLSVLSVACGDGGVPLNPPPTNVPTVPPALTREVVLSGLSSPWDIAFAPDGTMFFTEKCGGLSVRRSDGTVTRLFGAGGALPAPDLVCLGKAECTVWHWTRSSPSTAECTCLWLPV